MKNISDKEVINLLHSLHESFDKIHQAACEDEIDIVLNYCMSNKDKITDMIIKLEN